MGDVSTVIPSIQPYAGGVSGSSHGDDYQVLDPELACIKSAQLQVLMAAELLKDDAARARQIMENFTPVYPTIADYFAAVDQFMRDIDLVSYTENGAEILF